MSLEGSFLGDSVNQIHIMQANIIAKDGIARSNVTDIHAVWKNRVTPGLGLEAAENILQRNAGNNAGGTTKTIADVLNNAWQADGDGFLYLGELETWLVDNGY